MDPLGPADAHILPLALMSRDTAVALALLGHVTDGEHVRVAERVVHAIEGASDGFDGGLCSFTPLCAAFGSQGLLWSSRPLRDHGSDLDHLRIESAS